MILSTNAVVVERERRIHGAEEIKAANAISRVTFMVYWYEVIAMMLQNRDAPFAGTKESDVIHLPATIIVKSEDGICCGEEIISSNPVSGIPLFIHRRESSIVVFEDPKRASARLI